MRRYGAEADAVAFIESEFAFYDGHLDCSLQYKDSTSVVNSGNKLYKDSICEKGIVTNFPARMAFLIASAF